MLKESDVVLALEFMYSYEPSRLPLTHTTCQRKEYRDPFKRTIVLRVRVGRLNKGL